MSAPPAAQPPAAPARPLRLLFGYGLYRHPVDPRRQVEAQMARLRAAGIDIACEVLTLDPPGPCLAWAELDARWRRGDRALLGMYERLARRLEDRDVLINGPGINLHPEFVRQLPVFTVFACYDDPESSAQLSRPAAAAYDLALVGNLAELDAYRAWGVRHVRHWPLGFTADEHDPALTRTRILEGERPVEVALLCERQGAWRSARLDAFRAAFPGGTYRGLGWPEGFLDEAQRVPLYQRCRIGPNFHNSTGPVNSRTFVLPANGVMLLCDNRAHLAQLYAPGVEAVGFDTVDQAIELCRHYLAHDDERRRIAAAGWERAHRDYNEVARFRLVERHVAELTAAGAVAARPPIAVVPLLARQRRGTRARRLRHALALPARACAWLARLPARLARRCGPRR